MIQSGNPDYFVSFTVYLKEKNVHSYNWIHVRIPHHGSHASNQESSSHRRKGGSGQNFGLYLLAYGEEINKNPT